jgi:biotin synthase
VANTRDITHKEGEQLLDAGFVGAYHAVRLGEQKDTPFVIRKRIQTIKVLKDVGLHWMNCVEPVGPEHDTGEIVDLMLLARKYRATYSGVMRRINFPGSPMERYGMITEREMARMVAVSRLVMGNVPRAHCTHEPHTASLMAGANLFFPEVGSNPRDGKDQVKAGRGRSLQMTRQIQLEMGLDPLLPSNCFNEAPSGLGALDIG